MVTPSPSSDISQITTSFILGHWSIVTIISEKKSREEYYFTNIFRDQYFVNICFVKAKVIDD